MARERDDRGRFLPAPNPAQGLGEFARRIKIRGENVPIGTSDLIRKMALAIDEAIVLATPVDTGRARSNWILNIGSPVTEVRSPYQPGSGGGSTQGALDQARSAIAASPDFVRVIYITNNLSYIGYLNDGSSAQAAKNFVQTGIVNGSAKVLKTGTVRVTSRG